MNKIRYVKLINKILAISTLVLPLVLYGNNSSATFIPVGSSVQETAENAGIDPEETSALSGAFHENGENESEDRDGPQTAVPESSTIVLVSAGFFGLAVYCKRHRDKDLWHH